MPCLRCVGRGAAQWVNRVDIFACCNIAATPATLDVFDKADKSDTTTKHDTLTKDPVLGNILAGKLTDMALPATPVTDLKLFFEGKVLSDL